MRWIWIDKFIEFKSGLSAVAVKNVTLAEEHLHDHFPGFPVMPECLMIEGMAQTGGILVGHARDFAEKVVLAKISKAQLNAIVRPGDQLTYHAEITNIAEGAAAVEALQVLVGKAPQQEVELLHAAVPAAKAQAFSLLGKLFGHAYSGCAQKVKLLEQVMPSPGPDVQAWPRIGDGLPTPSVIR